MRTAAATLVLSVALLAPPAVDASVPCPVFSAPVDRGTVDADGLEEISGLAAGRANPGRYWAHEDSGAGADLSVLAGDGSLVATYQLTGVSPTDWEDIAIGPGPVADRPYLYVGDIGDNTSVRPGITIHRVPEPVVTPAEDPIALAGTEPLPVVYPDGAHDAETLLSDPRTGDLYLVTKSFAGTSGVYRYPAPHTPGVAATLEHVGDLSTLVFTGGDFSPSGDEILLRTYSEAFAWRRGPAQSVAEALEGAACEVPLADEVLGEAIAYRADGNAYLSTSERFGQGPQPLYLYRARWRPDATIRRGARPPVGVDVHNGDGTGQTLAASVGPGGRITYIVGVVNDGDRTDDVTVQGSRSSHRFRVRYVRAGVDISGAVKAGTYEVEDLAPGASAALAVQVTARPGAPSGATHGARVVVRSGTVPARVDVVRAVTTRR
jgi:hypothetical protein